MPQKYSPLYYYEICICLNGYELTRVISGKLNFFDVELNTIECIHMDTNPYLVITVKKSPWSNTKPQMIIKASVIDQNGNKETYIPFKGVIDEYDKEIDIVTH